LEPDVAAKLKAEARRSGRPFKQVVNDAIRRGMLPPPRAERRPYRVRARSLGGVQPGVSLDNIGALLEQVEGPLHR
jgi:hypothetical protein